MKKLLKQINQSEYDFFFLVVDKFLDIHIPEIKNFYSITNSNLATKNSGYLLSLTSTQNFIKETVAKSGHKVAIIPFKPSAKIDHICRQNSWLPISNPSPLNRLLEDKIKFVDICKENDLPIVPTIVNKFSETSFKNAQQTLGEELVIQTHFGWAGNSSHLANSYKTVENNIPQNAIVKFSKFLSGYSLINNCCVTKNGLIQSPVGLQYTGIKELTSNPLATVGRQWPCFAPINIQNQVRDITEDFSKTLIKLKYRGFFGLDFLVSNDHVYILECNPRLTASFAFYTELELKCQLDPLFYYHILEFIGRAIEPIDRFDAKITGSEITLKNTQGTTIKKYHDFVAFSPKCNPVSISSSVISKLK